VDLDEDAPSSYSTETAPAKGTGSGTIAPGAATGRRKEAVARVRIIPGTGVWKINGRTLENYFPNKVHQQLVNDPFKVTDWRAAST
jgi:small subunit ribosomal protein S9